MFVFLLPFVVIVGTLLATDRGRPAPVKSAGMVIGAAPPRQHPAQNAPPSPLAVLYDYTRANVVPPPFVVQCAIAEAEILGRFDVAHMITKTFLIPALAQGGASAVMQAPASAPPGVIDAQAKEAPGPTPAGPQAPPAPTDAPTPAPERVIEQGPASSPPLPTVSTRSPIPPLPDEAWQMFAGLMVREAPTFDGPRHVGRYRHSRDRLAAIGFEPSIVLESIDVQDDAFAADAADAFRHLAHSGTLDQVIGRGVQLPDIAEPVAITCSGVLALALVGGLEGAIGWLERSDDRKRYPHTTAAFLRGNGVF